MTTVLRIAVAAVILYMLISAAFFVVMLQSPGTFAKTMMHVPWVAFGVFPLRSMWMKARSGTVQQGEMAPDFSLESTDHRSHFQLSSLRGQKPAVLVFGSYTCPPFRKKVPLLNDIYEQYKDRVVFTIVYIREAHASDMWQDPDNFTEHVYYKEPKSIEERSEMGQLCVAKLGLKFPAVVDGLDNATERAYTGWPSRLYVIDRDGRVAYKSAPGPYGFRPQEVADTLRRIAPPRLRSGLASSQRLLPVSAAGLTRDITKPSSE
jgi:thiol-disulfide isomerase/thioredoxin